jgi:anthranilate/para-aminobenzoate synthase component I
LGLLASAKERAENTMIVDMVRNDLSRVCAPGSVAVPHLLDCEPYTTLWHLESEVHGRMVGGARHGDLLSAILPPASVTGCPKVAAMGFIAGAEARRRGPYCGAMGLALAGGRADWSVGIRQLNVVDGRVQLSVGSGIVADSVAEREWAETCLKAAGGLLWLRRLVGLLAPRLSGQPRVAWRP